MPRPVQGTFPRITCFCAQCGHLLEEYQQVYGLHYLCPVQELINHNVLDGLTCVGRRQRMRAWRRRCSCRALACWTAAALRCRGLARRGW